MSGQIKTILVVVALSATAVAANAASANAAPAPVNTFPMFSWSQGVTEKLIPMADGSTLHAYSDGKMAMESKYGRAVLMKQGQVMQASDGTSITMTGDEVARLSNQLRSHSRR